MKIKDIIEQLTDRSDFTTIIHSSVMSGHTLAVKTSGRVWELANAPFKVLDLYYCPELFDMDDDEVPDSSDNCVFMFNPDQSDIDQDGIGDICEIPGDINGDGNIDLADVIHCLQILTGYPNQEGFHSGTQIGIKDAIKGTISTSGQ